MSLRPEIEAQLSARWAKYPSDNKAVVWSDDTREDFLRARIRHIADILQDGGTVEQAAEAVCITVDHCERLIESVQLRVPTQEELLKRPTTGYLRVRFIIDSDFADPVEHAPLPSWITGAGDNYVVIVAYVRDGQYLKQYWPSHGKISFIVPCEKIEFTERFPKPHWFDPNNIQLLD